MRILIVMTCLCGLVLGNVGSVQAEGFPPVKTADLPVAGTCAPIRRKDVTHVMVGRKDRFGSYRVAALRGQVLNDVQLARYLAEMAAKSPSPHGSDHSVWITAAHDHRWAHIVKVILHCTAAKIYRVGVRVRSEATQRPMGFPLFLPPAPGAGSQSTGKATQLPVRLQTFAEDDAKGRPTIPGATPIERDRPEDASDLHNVYVAAKIFAKRLGKIVATVRLATNATVQDAIRVLDMLYRAGCSGVRLLMTTNVASPKVDVYSVVSVNSVALGNKAPEKPPTIQPRAEPWGLYGANESDWVRLQLVPVPTAASGGNPDAGTLPNHLKLGSITAHAYEQADASVRNWAQGLSTDLLASARGGPQLAVHLNAKEGRPEALTAAAKPAMTFASAQSLTVSTLLVSVDLFQGNQGVGVVDLHVFFGATQTQIVWARWKPNPPTGTPPAPEQDAYVRGLPGQLRTFAEAIILRAIKEGSGALPMADGATVLGAFPPTAHAWMNQHLRRRPVDMAQLITGLRGATFDRAVLRPGQLVATAVQGGRVAGLLYATVDGENGELRLSRLNAHPNK